ncbi:hypothetical protein ACVIHC_008287 [Bradyrhizobium diazoefficiens]
MSGARTSALATLRSQIERIETAEVVHQHDRVALGHGEVDSALKGGLARAAIHEVFCEGRQGAAATGFVMGVAGRVTARRPLLWVRQDFSELEAGALSMSGLAELGLDPRRVVMVRAADVESALRTSADALACDALGAVVLELLGRDAAIRSRGEPQADAGRARLRRHRPAVADGRAAAALDCRDQMDAARGAFAAGHDVECLGRAALRCRAVAQSSWPVRPVDHGMEM